MNKFKVPSGEIIRRKAIIQKELQNSGIDGLFIVQRVDLFYFSGTAQNGYLYMPAEGEPLLFIKRYMPRAQEETSLKNVVEIKSIKEVPGLISDFYGNLPGKIGFEFDVLPVRDFNFYKSLFHIDKYIDGSTLIHNVRMIKSDWEIEQMERTAELSKKTFEYMKTAIRPGLTEMEFAGMYETFARKLGHGAKLRIRDFQTEGYPWHILRGTNCGLVGSLNSPFSRGRNKLLTPNEPIIIDLPSVLNGFHMDETRMFAIGSMPDRAMDACRAAIDIHNAVLEIVKPGITFGELFHHSVETAESLGYSAPYLGPPGYKVNFIGHGVGLELIEHPIIAIGEKDRIEPGTTFALESKMVFKNEFSAGIKSVFLATEQGARLISKVPLEIFIC